MANSSMSSFNIRLITAAAAAATCTLAAGAFAQDRHDARPGEASDPHAFAEHRKEHMQEHQAERAKALHDVLNIRADQESAFQAFVATMRPAHDGAMGEHRQHDGGPDAAPLATTPERLDRMVARLHEREQRLETRVSAVKTFYAALSPEQRRAFDSLPMLAGGGDKMMGRGGKMDHEGMAPRG